MNSSGESAAREQWMMDAAAEFIAPGTPPSMAAHMKEQYAGWIARHYAARAREVQELVKVLEWLDRRGGLGLDAHEFVRHALAPFAAKGETE